MCDGTRARQRIAGNGLRVMDYEREGANGRVMNAELGTRRGKRILTQRSEEYGDGSEQSERGSCCKLIADC